MRRNFLLAIALAVTGALIVVGSAGARTDLLDTGNGGVEINLPEGEDLPPMGSLPECANLRDDDDDGSTDLADPDCGDPLDNSEADSTAPPDDDPLPDPDPEPDPDPGPGTGPGTGDPGTGGGGGGNGSTGGGNGSDNGGNGQDGTGGSGGDKPDDPMEKPTDRNPDGSPTDTNPSLTIADFGPAPIGVPNFVIDQFAIPPFLLPIYQACGTAVRDPLAGARLDQPDRDRLRHQPQRLHRRRRWAGCSSSPRPGRPTGSTPTTTGARTPTTRSTRSAPPPAT